MPEGLEAEIWCRASQRLVGREIVDVWVDERVAPADLPAAVVGAHVAGVRRRGKILLFDLAGADANVLGFHFGMTGRLIVDGRAPIERLEYASGADRPEWDRLRLGTGTVVAALRLNDPRRLGRVALDPDLSRLGPDALTLTSDQLSSSLRGRRAAIKTLLLDQEVVAGIGNLCADEVLLHAGLRPRRTVDSLGPQELDALASACRSHLPRMLARGGSTTGALSPELRAAIGACPLDGAPLARSTVGGRTTVWCPRHQT